VFKCRIFFFPSFKCFKRKVLRVNFSKLSIWDHISRFLIRCEFIWTLLESGSMGLVRRIVIRTSSIRPACHHCEILTLRFEQVTSALSARELWSQMESHGLMQVDVGLDHRLPLDVVRFNTDGIMTLDRIGSTRSDSI
jgi:hypothetical protein